MNSEKITPIDFESVKQRLTRYSIATINAAALLGTIVFVTWILGKIIAALHALVFSLALADVPRPPAESLQMPGESFTHAELQSIRPDLMETTDSTNLYSVDHNNWGQ